jgi:hypothetical protein
MPPLETTLLTAETRNRLQTAPQTLENPQFSPAHGKCPPTEPPQQKKQQNSDYLINSTHSTILFTFTNIHIFL